VLLLLLLQLLPVTLAEDLPTLCSVLVLHMLLLLLLHLLQLLAAPRCSPISSHPAAITTCALQRRKHALTSS
jgi:hypothetical protein